MLTHCQLLLQSSTRSQRIMSQFSIVIVCAIFSLTIKENVAHTYHLGSCPEVEPMRGFNMEKLLGVWYAIEKTSTASSCIAYNFSRTEEPNEYELVQTSQHFALGLTPVDHVYKYTGELRVPDRSIPAKMIIKFPLNVGSSNFTVIDTDYRTYAVVFTCQKLAFANRHSATILSRDKTLDKDLLQQFRDVLSSAKIDPHDLSTINQTNCPKVTEKTRVINIDDETLSAKSFGNLVRTIGSKIGDGVEYVAGGVGKVYDKVVGSKKED